MIESARSPVALAARILAVAFALSVLGYFVVTAQQRARAPAAAAADAAAEPESAPGEESVFLHSSKFLKLGEVNSPVLSVPGSVEHRGDPTKSAGQPFLHGSKSMVITDITNMDDGSAITLGEGESDVAVEPPALPVPPVGAEPQFLPSSKSRTQLLPALRPKIVPGTTTPTPPVATPPKDQKLETVPAPKH
ncbi:MAG: hypothetical protein JNL28_14375 [Planctomycetes bacterium]|nr:hypothetical protein [Planctomycetota bacterium]